MKLTLENLFMYVEEEGECLLWKLGTNCYGRPQARIDGKTVSVRDHVWGLRGGTFGKGLLLTCACGNNRCLSHLKQVNRSQLLKQVWKSGARSGVKGYLSKIKAVQSANQTRLTPEIVMDLRRSEEPSSVLAKKYGVTRHAISDARRGVTWRHVGNPFFRG